MRILNFFRIVFSCLLCVVAVRVADAQLIVADDFLYNQATKAFGPGGGFLQQEYAGGQNGAAGRWLSEWVSTGDGVVTGADITEEAGYIVDQDQFLGATRNGLSENHLQRGFGLNTLVEDTVYFGVTLRNRDEAATKPLFTLNDPGGMSQISMGFSEDGGLTGILGETIDGIEGPGLTDGIDPYKLIGKLELNANADDERLTVWLDPTNMEEAENSFSVEADVLSSFADLAGTLRLDHNFSGSVVYWDDVALGTSWDAVASVDIPRATLLMDPDNNATAIVNTTESEIDAIYYEVSSESGRIRTRSWTSLESQGVAGWKASPETANLLIESNLRESTLLLPGDQLLLGEIASKTRNDLAGTIAGTDGLLNVLKIEFGPVGSSCNANTSGDFDGNGRVEFADFLTLSSNFGKDAPDHTSGDADCNGKVEFADFLILSSNFGKDVGGAQSVPEPSSWGMLGLSVVLLLSRFRRRQ